MKQIPKTSAITARLNRAVGAGASTDNLVVYEAVALNTRPLRKRGHPLYKGARPTRGLLLEMAAALENESVPMQIMHNGNVLPLGRAFHAEVAETAGETELRALFFIDKTNPEMIAKIDAGTVDQVSVQVLSKKLTCSACGFDYFGKDVSIDQVFSGTCDKGHVLGENGVHANLVGLDYWSELSLVGTGAAQGARIVDPANSRFSSENALRLAASGRALDDFILTASAEPATDDTMDLTATLAALTASTVDAANAKAEITRLTAAATVAATELTAAQAEIARLTTLVASAGDAAATITARDATIAAQAAELTASEAALRSVLTKALVASGTVNPTLPATLAEVITGIEAAGPKLAAALAIGGRSTASDALDAPKTNPAASAFRSPAR